MDAQFAVGDKVRANYKGIGKWYPSQISRNVGDGTFDITYDDGDREDGVAEEMIERRKVKAAFPSYFVCILFIFYSGRWSFHQFLLHYIATVLSCVYIYVM